MSYIPPMPLACVSLASVKNTNFGLLFGNNNNNNIILLWLCNSRGCRRLMKRRRRDVIIINWFQSGKKEKKKKDGQWSWILYVLYVKQRWPILCITNNLLAFQN